MFEQRIYPDKQHVVSSNTSVPEGVYKHYKGAYYLVFGIATHTETSEQYVVYQSLYGQLGVWIRPLTMFVSQVEHEGIVQPRFTKVAESQEVDTYIQ